jgi:glycosyltransferase involved in cell wall biosynthesis
MGKIHSSSPNVSIAMATYNGERYIREQLDSVAAQTLLPCELVVTDDGSVDQTIEIVKKFAQTAPFEVRIFQNRSRLGFADNFFKAADLCQGDIIAFCDQDDKWHPEKLKICLREFEDTDVLLCVHSSIVGKDEHEPRNRRQGFRNRKVILSGVSDPLTGYAGFSMLFRRVLVDSFEKQRRPCCYNGAVSPPEPMAHDQFISFVASVFGKIVLIPDDLAFYRQHDRNVSGVSPNRGIFGTIRFSINSLNYEDASRHTIDCAAFLERASNKFNGKFKNNSDESACRLRKRAKLLKLRARIYDKNSIFSARLKFFFEILVSEGYFLRQNGSRLGPKAAIKDALFGVTGLYRGRFD